MTAELDRLRGALEEILAKRTASAVRIYDLRSMAGGASQETWQFDMQVETGEWQGRHALVVRRPLGGKIYRDALDLEREYRVLEAAYASGVPVPRPYGFVRDLLGRPAALLARLEGETIGRKIVQDAALAGAREKLPAQMGRALAQIHAVDVRAYSLREVLLAPALGQTPTGWNIEQLTANLDDIGEPHPALELGLRWLASREPAPPAQLTLVHGDYRIGNLVVNAGGLVGVLDWEFAHLGDPVEDVAWGLVRDWRFGVDSLRLGGIAAPDPFFAAYEQATGKPLEPARILYWEVMGNVRWGVGMLNQAQRHLRGEEPNLEFASLGRRCAEIEWEVIQLIKTNDERRTTKD